MRASFNGRRNGRPGKAIGRATAPSQGACAHARLRSVAFKTMSIFDATATHPEWLGEEPERVQQLMPQ